MTFNRHRDSKIDFLLNQTDESSSLNQVAEDLLFFPINGPSFRLSELKDKKAVIIFMRERSCPISEKYGLRQLSLEKEYSKKGIQFIYNYVGQVRAEKNAEKDLKNFGFKAPYVIDSHQKAINALNAKTTGDVFILTPKRRVIYKGPIDDQYHLLKTALKAKKHYVSDRLSILAEGKKVEPKELPAPGCIISRKDY